MNIPTSSNNSSDAEILFHSIGALQIVTLNRERAYNAMNYAMREMMSAHVPGLASDPENYALVIQSNSEKAFCAGADVREIVKRAQKDQATARAAFKAEYTLNWQLECFTKPTVSLMNGMVIGSGVGITAYGTHRVAGEKYWFSMPETAIGLFPDVGVACILAKMPDEIGTYLGLTGAKVSRADAYELGLVTHCISAQHFDAIKNELADAQPVDPVLDGRHESPGPGELKTLRDTISTCFSKLTVEEIVESLTRVQGANAAWAQGVVADLKTRSPLSLKVTLEHLRRSKNLTLKKVLEVDYRLACRFLEGSDFYEGVRAALIDKDGKPNWLPPTLEQVSKNQVDDYFTPMDDDELVLPERQANQSNLS